MDSTQVVGRPLTRVDALSKVLGQSQFSTDMTMQGMLVSRVLRSPYPHAQVLRIDTSKAKNLEGVAAVLTAKDIEGTNTYGGIIEDQPVLVREGDKARFIGDAIALVAAASEEIAATALELVEVDYQILPAVTDADEALKPGAPLVHDKAEGNRCGPPFSMSRGDVEKGFAEADAIVETVFFPPRQEHAYLEVESGLAYIDHNNVVTVCAGSQDPVGMRYQTAKALGIPESKLRFISPYMGGAFGSKLDVSVHIHLALLAQITRRPVKMVWTREESFLVSVKRLPVRIRHKLGATKDGRLTAMEVDFVGDGGPYASRSPSMMMVMGGYLNGPYNIPNAKITGRIAYTNNPISGAFRGYGGPQGIVATESQIDILARKLGMDPVKLRRKNMLEQGMPPSLPGTVLDTPVSLPITLDRALDAAGAPPKSSGKLKKTGRGLCTAIVCFDISARPSNLLKGTGAYVELFPDGTVLIRSGVCEHGSGIQTVLIQVAAEELGVRPEDVTVVLGDTQVTPKSGPAVASRQAYTSGNAVRLAASHVKSRVLTRAAERLETTPEMLDIREGRIFVKEYPDRWIRLSEVATSCFVDGVNLGDETWFTATHANLGHTFMTTIADVEVDEETGEVKVVKMVTAHDTGKALNPVNVRGQIMGGELQGIGYAVMEDMPSAEGKILTPTFTEYLVPTMTDIPEDLISVIVEEPYPTGPYGAKGLGEHTMDSTAPAILNAIEDAVGVRITQFPATPERVLKALRAKGATVSA